MKQLVCFVLVLMSYSACQESITQEENTITVEKPILTKYEIDSITTATDTLLKAKKLTRYSYPSMHMCGGGVTGYYLDSNLLLVDAVYQAELGYTSRKVYWQKDKIIKLIYHEHMAEWGKYVENYPPDEYEYDPNKMTYSDTIYQTIDIVGNQFEIITNNKTIKTEKNKKLMKDLISCGLDMKSALVEEKQLEE